MATKTAAVSKTVALRGENKMAIRKNVMEEAHEEMSEETSEALSHADKKKARAKDEYEERLTKVRALKEMTDTKAWLRYYDSLIGARKYHEQAILTEEKTRAMVAHQEAIKFINETIKKIQEPIDELNGYCSAMPLFGSSFHTRAQWNPAIGTVELVEAR